MIAPAPSFNSVKPARASFAVNPFSGKGRLLPEDPSPTRTDFQRDRDRIIHCAAFRRLGYKTQVFVPHEGDHYRTRLTHTIEVAQIARALARALGLDEDLAECLALAHDLGHTPFGHAGEDALHACMAPYGGFDHNAQALRIVTRLERRYANFDGLNLTWESLEGLVKHNGPLVGASSVHKPVPEAIFEFDALFPLDLASFASAEAQCAALADDIAYNAHDIDDGLRAGLFGLDDLRAVPFLDGLLRDISTLHPHLERSRTIHELGRRVITCFVEDAIFESRRRLMEAGVANAADVRRQPHAMVAFSEPFVVADKAIKGFLMPRMYRHPRVMRIRDEASAVIDALFPAFLARPSGMPQSWAEAIMAVDPSSPAARARIVSDYIAGMTDRFALQEHQRLFGSAPELK